MSPEQNYNGRGRRSPVTTILIISLVLGGAIFLLNRVITASANTSDYALIRDTYPNIIDSRIDSCSLCHTSSVPLLNPYGSAYAGLGRDNPASLHMIEELDSDGDGYTNIAEIDALTFPGNASDWPHAAINPAYPPPASPTKTTTPTVGGYPAPVNPTNTSLPPTATNTRVPPTATNTRVPPTATNTRVPPTATNTSVPPTATNTGEPPTATNTSIPPTATNTGEPPAATNTSVPPTATNTSVPPTATNTRVPPTATATVVSTAQPTVGATARATSTLQPVSTKGPEKTRVVTKTLRPTRTIAPTRTPRPTKTITPTKTLKSTRVAPTRRATPVITCVIDDDLKQGDSNRNESEIEKRNRKFCPPGYHILGSKLSDYAKYNLKPSYSFYSRRSR